MSIFVLGRSRTGKSPFAQEISRFFHAQHIGASEWVRSRFIADDYGDDRAAFVAAITKFSLQQLAENPSACVDFIRSKYDLGAFCVIEGLRNPSDFIKLFDSRKDAVVFLEHENGDLPVTEFETGLETIKSYLNWLVRTSMLPANRVNTYRFKDFRDPADTAWSSVIPDYERVQPTGAWSVPTLEHAITDFCVVQFDYLVLPADSLRPSSLPSHAQRRHVHADIVPIKCQLRAEYLYDMDMSHAGELVPCTLFAVTAYKGESLTFKVLLEDGTVFSYIPPSALVHMHKEQTEPQLALAELVYHNCPDGKFCMNTFGVLPGHPVNAFFKGRNIWMKADYLFTVDWYEGNDLLHFIALENGQYAFLPHHKVKFRDGARSFQPFRKIHSKWIVPNDMTAPQ